MIWVSILGVLPFTLAAAATLNLFWTAADSVAIGLILASAFSAIIVYAQELMPGNVGAIAGLFFGLRLRPRRHRRGGARRTRRPDQHDFVYQVCAFLPAIGLLTFFLPGHPLKAAVSRWLRGAAAGALAQALVGPPVSASAKEGAAIDNADSERDRRHPRADCELTIASGAPFADQPPAPHFRPRRQIAAGAFAGLAGVPRTVADYLANKRRNMIAVGHDVSRDSRPRSARLRRS